MHDNLSIILVERMAVIAITAYLFSQTTLFRRIFTHEMTLREKFWLTVVFGLVAITGTYLSIPVEGALANVRDIGSIVGGLLGGPWVGLGAGLIAGLHRMCLGGFTAFACGFTTIIGGLAAGLVNRWFRPRLPEWVTGAITGIAVILFSMGLILLVSKPYSAALSLVKKIAFPMTLANALGISIFMLIIHNVYEQQEQIAATQTHRALKIANKTLPFLRKGLNAHSATQVAETILGMTQAVAVSITDREQILAHVGAGRDHHRPGQPYITRATKKVFATGRIAVAKTKAEIGCPEGDCPLLAAVIVPLFCKEEITGTLKMYFTKDREITPLDIEFAKGLGQMISTQVEIAMLQKQAELVTHAELKALRAQINPHFLFNALNTIVYLCRTDPEAARQLLIKLSEFFRRNLKTAGDFVTLREELEHVELYLSLEKARFGDRLNIVNDVDPRLLEVRVPVLTLQPLIENAVKHGLLTREQGGTVMIRARARGRDMELTVADNGLGIARSTLGQLLHSGCGQGIGIGLTNVNERLKTIYGQEYALKVDSSEGKGTTIQVRIPLRRQAGGGVS